MNPYPKRLIEVDWIVEDVSNRIVDLTLYHVSCILLMRRYSLWKSIIKVEHYQLDAEKIISGEVK